MGLKISLSIAIAVASCPVWASERVAFALKSEDAEIAASLAAKYGRLVGKDRHTGSFILETQTANEAKHAARELSKRKGVVYARVREDVAWNTTDWGSVKSVSRTINEFKARNGDIEKLARAQGRPLPTKIDKIKTGYNDAYLFWLSERAFPFDRIDAEAYDRAVAHRDNMEPAFAGVGDGLGATSFSFIGPTNLDIPYSTYYGRRPINGRANAMAVHPTNPNIMYLAAAQGGVWKTTDGGMSWNALTDHWTWTTTSSIAIDPVNPNTVYVGTGDYPGSKPYCLGVMKSIDGGASWTQLGAAQFGNRAINSIVVDPENPQIVTVATGRGAGGSGWIWRSTNGGLTWTQCAVNQCNWARLEIGALNIANGQRAYYASGSGTGGNVWRSLDRGATWTQLTTPASAATNHSVIQVAASPTTPGTVYMSPNADRKVFKSIDSGATWSDITGAFPNGSNNYFWSQSTYNWFFDVSTKPGGVDVIYIGLIDVAQSPDGGVTWRSIGGPTFVSGALTHNDQHFVEIDPSNPNRVYIGGDGGAYRYTFDPVANSGTWTYLSANLGITQFYKMDTHPTSLNHVIGGTQDNATPVAVGDLANWDNCGGGDGGFAAINQVSPNIQYSTSQNLAVYRTTNTWSTQSTITPSKGSDSVAFIAPIVLDPNNQGVLYAGTNYLYRRTDSTGAWENRLGGQLLSATGNLRGIAVAPGDANRIYTVASDGQVWMSQNRGANWTLINTGTVSLPTRTFNYISVNPANKNDILVSCSGTGTGHVWRCADTTAANRTWINVSGSGPTGLPDIPANTIYRDWLDFDNTWFVGTDIGLFMTENGGQTWTNATQPLGLPNTQVNDLRIQQSTEMLYVATYGRGMWRLQLPKVVYPSSFSVAQGTLLGGNLNSLRLSDDQPVAVLADEFNTDAIVEANFSVVSPTISGLNIFVEYSASRTGLVQFLEGFEYGSADWALIDASNVQLLDVRERVDITTNPTRFVQSGTNAAKFRVRWAPSESYLDAPDWTIKLDRFHLRVLK